MQSECSGISLLFVAQLVTKLKTLIVYLKLVQYAPSEVRCINPSYGRKVELLFMCSVFPFTQVTHFRMSGGGRSFMTENS